MTITTRHTATLAATGALALGLLAKALAAPPGVLVFSADGSGRGQGAILHPGTPQLVDANFPARAGDVVEIYLTGPAGDLKKCPAGAACEAAAAMVLMGGLPAPVLFAGRPESNANLLQVNALIPEGIAGSKRVPVLITAWGKAGNEVTLAVR